MKTSRIRAILRVILGSGYLASSATAGTIDYAQARHVDDWLRHPVYGDPSFDAFERMPGNPIHLGAAPFEWPVNGFFFEDPASGQWYLYVGEYGKGYLTPPSRCVLYRSSDRGRTWSNLGVILHGDPRMFDKGGHTPDVSVVYAEGRYHMVYDWGEPDFNAEGGLAYAWAEQPEGPWHRAPEPITRNSSLTKLAGRYQRTYAATLLHRSRDWLILAMMDHAPNSWALFAMTALKPEGPYSERRLVRQVEENYFHPPLMEFFPAFAHNGIVYAPATSVALNRNFNALFSAPLEQADEASAWSLSRYGSVFGQSSCARSEMNSGAAAKLHAPRPAGTPLRSATRRHRPGTTEAGVCQRGIALAVDWFILTLMGLDLEQMSREEKLKAMHQLWEDLARDEATVESPAWHGDALREVEERIRQGVERVHDWEDAKKELRRRME